MIGMARLGTRTASGTLADAADRGDHEGLAAEPVLALDGRLEHVVAVLDAVDDLGVLGGGAGRLGLGLELLVGDPHPGGGRPQLGLVRARPASGRAVGGGHAWPGRSRRCGGSAGRLAGRPRRGRRGRPRRRDRGTRWSRRRPRRCRRPGGGRWRAGTRPGGGRRRPPARGGRPSGCGPRAPISSPAQALPLELADPGDDRQARVEREGERGRPCFDHEAFVPHLRLSADPWPS